MMSAEWLTYVLREYGEQLTTEDGTIYYHIPYWFTIDYGKAVLHTKEPEELKMAITAKRLGRPYGPPFKGLKNE